MLSDIEIAQNSNMQPIEKVAEQIGMGRDDLEFYGKYKAKISFDFINSQKDKKDGKLVLVTAINPTPAGEGKTTTTVGLGQAMAKIGEKAVIALREPSLGPVFGVKGGAAGGGYAQVVPMEDINLHFTGDMHAIGAANNLLCAMIDNHIQQGNALDINSKRIAVKRVVDMNDRALRNIIIGLGKESDGVVRQDGFMITVASEVMAILCLSADLIDLKEKLGDMVIAYSNNKKPITARDLKANGAMAVLLKDAIKPNLVQTLENTPCIMHGGPFANIAHGCNSLIATKLALKMADYTITEAGFGADLGAEKFFDIKCRKGGLNPDCVVIVATIRALKYNGGVNKKDLKEENIDALKKGIVNLGKHIENIQKFGVKPIVALNSFYTDTESEFEIVKNYCDEYQVKCIKSTVYADGGGGGVELAKAVVEECINPSDFKYLYDEELSIEDKINKIAKEIYGADEVVIDSSAKRTIKSIEKNGYTNLPVCMAKTQYSLSDNSDLLGRPEGFSITVADVKLSAGAGFVVALTGDIMTMPGLPKEPTAEIIDIDANGDIFGLF